MVILKSLLQTKRLPFSQSVANALFDLSFILRFTGVIDLFPSLVLQVLQVELHEDDEEEEGSDTNPSETTPTPTDHSAADDDPADTPRSTLNRSVWSLGGK